MANSTDKTLVDLFPWLGSDEVLKNLRLLMQALEGRISPLEADRVGYVETITALRILAIDRIAEVLDPAEQALRDLISVGFSADKIADSTATGREVMRIASYAALKAKLEIAIADVAGAITGNNPTITGGTLTESTLEKPTLRNPESSGGNFGNPLISGGRVKDLLSNASTDEIVSAAFVRALVKAVSDRFVGVLRYDEAQTINESQQAIAIANAIGYRPLRHGGGVSHEDPATHPLMIGSIGQQMVAQLNGQDIGRIWCDANAPSFVSANGYQKTPGGLIMQWGALSASPDQRVTFPIAFPSATFVVCPSLLWGSGTNETWAVTYDGEDRFGFTAHPRRYANSGLNPGPAIILKYIAFGV